MSQAKSEPDLIYSWINSLSVDFKKSPNSLIALSEDTLKNLLQNLITFFISKSTRKGYTLKLIEKNKKKTLEVKVNQPGFESILETYFYKKKVNSSWTYLKFRHYQIKWNVNIHFVTSRQKAYYSKPKRKVQTTEPSQKKQLTKFSDYFDQESDSEN